MYIKTIHMLDMTLIRYKLFDPGVNYMFISDIWVPSHAFVTTCDMHNSFSCPTDREIAPSPGKL